jgi:hypothetical protein
MQSVASYAIDPRVMIFLKWAALPSFHDVLSLNLPHDVVAFTEEGIPVIQHLLLFIIKIFIFGIAIFDLERRLG